ncbi:MAG TPA: hypothetical protein VFT22_10280 [Kofleriaceae bacterium]|nr:hypothetical protein [Kofleriaceae bacterium]
MGTKDAPDSLKARADRAMREWKTPAARIFRESEGRRRRDDVRWEKKRRGQVDRGAQDPLPPTKAKKVSGQVTAVARGARRLLAPCEYLLLVEGQLVYLGGTSTFRRIGPGRAATDLYCGGEDERRAELTWAAAVLYLDFLAVYRALKVVASTRSQADELIAQWPHVDQRPVAEMVERGENGKAIFDALRALPRPAPPPLLHKVLSLVRRIGNGAHLMGANIGTLDLDEYERELVAGHSGFVGDLPDGVRRRLLQWREQQIHVRRIPALPRQRNGKTADPMGTALTDILFAEHSVSRRFSHVAKPPHRTLDVVSDKQLTTLYSIGPQRAAFAAAGVMLDRSPGMVRRLVQAAKVHGLVVPENRRQS